MAEANPHRSSADLPITSGDPHQGAALAPEQPGAFDRDTAVRRLDGGDRSGARARSASFTARISPAWSIEGRPHGGYLAAVALRALTETVEEQARAPRSLTIHFLRVPEPGELRIDAVCERTGRSLTALSARIEQDGATIALALAAFSLPRTSLEVAELPLPDVAAQDPSRQTTEELSTRIEQGLAPPFLRQLVVQPRGGSRPFSGSDAPLRAGAWLGLAEPMRPLDSIALALFSDALFPTPFVRLTERAGAPTIDLTVHFRTSLPPPGEHDPGELCYAEFRSGVIHDGFFEEDGVIWAADGAVLAQSRQLALLIGGAGR